MILEAFAKYLHDAEASLPASSVLARWLWERLTLPPECSVDKVLRAEIQVEIAQARRKRVGRPPDAPDTPNFVFSASSESGKRLLKSLYEYAMSYEQQKWARWVHRVKASDFNQPFRQD